MTWADVFIKFCTDRYVKQECERRKLHADSIEPAIIYGEITSDELDALLPSSFVNPNNGSTYQVRRTWWDDKFYLTSKDEVRRFLDWNRTSELDYTVDYDCNSFAVSLWGDARKWGNGLCLGMITMVKPLHAKNFFVDQNRKLWIIEPQNDLITYQIPPYIDHFLV